MCVLVWWFIGSCLWNSKASTLASLLPHSFPLTVSLRSEGWLGGEAVDISLWFCFSLYLRWLSSCFLSFLKRWYMPFFLRYLILYFCLLFLIYSLYQLFFLQTCFLSWQKKTWSFLLKTQTKAHPPFLTQILLLHTLYTGWPGTVIPPVPAFQVLSPGPGPALRSEPYELLTPPFFKTQTALFFFSKSLKFVKVPHISLVLSSWIFYKII